MLHMYIIMLLHVVNVIHVGMRCEAWMWIDNAFRSNQYGCAAQTAAGYMRLEQNGMHMVDGGRACPVTCDSSRVYCTSLSFIVSTLSTLLV